MDIKAKLITCFTFKSIREDGKIARIEVHMYDNDISVINKIILCVDDLTKDGFELIRKFKWGNLYVETTAFLNKSIFTIAAGIHDFSNNSVNKKASE